jgi:peptidoglycan-N-acetylglucosamine deacetylase
MLVRLRSLFVPAFLLASAALAAESPAVSRAVAVTIDDLPAPPRGVVSNEPAALATMTAKLLAALGARGVPAVGFVNEGKLDVTGEDEAGRAARIGVLAQWTAAGLELGNHTYSHESLNRLPLAAFEADVVRGEPVTRRLLAERGQRLRWFRHPFLQVGLELDKRRAFEAWLGERGYRVAPVTVDNDEWIFAFLYADALRRGDGALAERIAADYLETMERVFAFIEATSHALLGREPAQVLLLHANQLNADHLGELLDAVARRGYRFVTLDQALDDPAYARPDDYVGAWGISWLHHWEITEGRKRSPSPDPPAWILEAHAKLGG